MKVCRLVSIDSVLEPNFMYPTQSRNLRAWSRERFIVRGKENLQLMFKTPSSLIYLGEEFFLFFSCLFYLFLFNFYFYFILLYNTVLVLPYTDMDPLTLIYRFNELHGTICQVDSDIYLEMKRT